MIRRLLCRFFTLVDNQNLRKDLLIDNVVKPALDISSFLLRYDVGIPVFNGIYIQNIITIIGPCPSNAKQGPSPKLPTWFYPRPSSSTCCPPFQINGPAVSSWPSREYYLPPPSIVGSLVDVTSSLPPQVTILGGYVYFSFFSDFSGKREKHSTLYNSLSDFKSGGQTYCQTH